MNAFSRLPFRHKLVLSFAVAFLVVLLSTTILLANVALQRSLDDTKVLLSLLTDQVLINNEQTIAAAEKQIYSVYSSLDIPELMRRTNLEDSNSRQAAQLLQSALNLMVSEVYPFDFVLVRTLSGQDIHTGGKIAEGEAVYEQASSLIQADAGGDWQWVRSADGRVYVIRKVYTISPLSSVGTIVVRIMNEKLFALGAEAEQLNCSMLMFDRENHLLLNTGFLDEEKQRLIAQSMAEDGGLSDGFSSWMGTDFYVVVRRSRMWSVVGLLPMNRVYDVRRDVWLTSLLIAAVGLVSGIGLVIMLTKRLTRQLNVLTHSIDAVAVGNLEQIVPIYSQDDIGQVAIRFNNMTREIAELLQRLVNEEKHKNEAEFQMLEYRYRSLHTQINSHFIYNALETVNAFAKLKGASEVSKVVQLISRYFRNNTKNVSRQFITLQQEFDYLRDYAEIYRYIHGDRLVLKFNYSEAAQNALLPTMILQPVLENAFEHGMRAAKEQTSICLSAQIEGEDQLVIRIKDDGPGIPEEVKERILQPEAQQRKDARSGIGLRNVAERLNIIYAERAGVSVESSSSGTCVSITLPLNTIVQMPIEIG